jgi:hypothetical protein
MIWFLRFLFMVVIASMLWATTRASLQHSLFAIPSSVTSNGWFVATLFDAYWAFVTFYVWLAWRETRMSVRLMWFLPVMLLGNLAMSAYLLRELFCLPSTGPLSKLFGERRDTGLIFPALLLALSCAVYALA